MSPRKEQLLSVQLERWLPAPRELVWRALTESRLIRRWLMENDFQARPGHRFTLRAAPLPHWNGVAECEVLQLERPRVLMHSWNASAEEAARGPNTVVTYALSAQNGGTSLRFTQSGFRIEEGGRRQGADQHWSRFLDKLLGVVTELGEEERSALARGEVSGPPGSASSVSDV